ncbi:putative Xre family transcriptional regulator [Sphingobium sp. SYK-6]|uniref:helix-turn-helix domain-containing protein n=1 Tax=Sphingobium sp. (strain NBRC 103272 / SYK-6) TaxID=627192 RepID=UPI000227750F|nr:short-chain fatty acyl-CoA regulator family protein [Sphingobium sp. SYK-6]BAK67150.1 putative Xre family transcriptional regulator [Sphingobium sp. SYK-6]
MSRGTRLFVGQKVRQLRLDNRMDQKAMARLLDISVSYLSQLENNDRPLTAKVKAALASAFPLDWSAFDERQEEQLLGAFNWALANPGLGSPPPDPERAERLHLHYPDFAARYVELHHALRQTQERLAMMEEAIASDAAPAARAPWETVRDWFHESGNYIHALDVAAEDLCARLGLGGPDNEARLLRALEERHQCRVSPSESDRTMLRRYDAAGRQLSINAALPLPSRAFQIANQLMQFELGGDMAAIMAEAQLGDPVADQLLLLGLANYAAGALLMPYGHFRQSARSLRHDIDPLARQFGVSFEQACHRLSTLQRPGQRGIPFFFCRVDMAGNITKRHSATRLQFARFGGACPLWGVHEAVAIPDRIIVQLAEMPDGMRYVSMARGLVKPSGSYARAPRRYAVVLGCEIEHAGNFIYADGLRLTDEAAATPIGMSCRLCPREGCDQRAFPPLDRPIHIERDHRGIVPYGIG